MQATIPKKAVKVEKLKAPLLDPAFKYISSAATDVQATWRRFGWAPPSEVRARNEAR
jgi:hypothetical protein